MQLFLHIETKVEGDKHQRLRDALGMPGVPSLAFLAADGRLLARQDRRQYGVEELLATLQGEVAGFLRLEKQAAAGDVAAKGKLLARQIELGHLDVPAMRRALKQKGLSAELRERLGEKISSTELSKLLEDLDWKDKAAVGAAAKKILALHKELGVSSVEISAWVVVMNDAYHRKDASTFQLALTAVKASGMLSPLLLKRQQERLAEIQGKK